MCDSLPSVSTLKAQYWEAIRYARRLGLDVRSDPMVSLCVEGSRIDAVYITRRSNAIWHAIHEEILEMAERDERNAVLPKWELVPFDFRLEIFQKH